MISIEKKDANKTGYYTHAIKGKKLSRQKMYMRKTLSSYKTSSG